jgi:ketosteroid isomerase-like protein
MSQENVDLIRQGFEAFARGDVEFVIDLADAEIEWTPAIAPILGIDAVRGKDRLRRFLTEDIAAGFDDFHAEALSLEDHGENVLGHVRYSARGESSGLEIDQSFWSVYRLRDAKLVWMRDFHTRPEALDAIGVEE